MDNDEIGFMELLIVFAKHKKKIIGVTVAGAVLSIATSLVLPKTYLASTKLLPPQQSQSSASALLSQLGGIAGAAAAGAAGIKNPSDLYIGMMKSRTVADRLIARFELKKAYQLESQERARKRLEDSTTIMSGKDGLITIEVEGADQKLVAPLANAYVDELFRITKTLAVTDASQRRLFYERQLETTKDNLAKAEIALKGSMDARGMVSVDAESRALMETVARLRAQASAKEIELNSMRAFVTTVNPEYRRVEEELNGMRAELAKLENGRGANAPSSDAPSGEKQGGLENIKLLRNLKYQQMLYEVLAKQYEVARIDEAKDPSVIQVLDPAVDPEQRAKPRRALIVILSTMFAFVVGALWAYASEARRKAVLSPEGAAQWNELKSHLRLGKKP